MPAGCNSCQKESNTEGTTCPPRSYAMFLNDWRPRCVQNQMQRDGNKLKSSYDYRMWLQHNASDIMQNQRNALIDNHSCKPCVVDNQYGTTMLPEKYLQSCDANVCTMNLHVEKGLGHGRDFGSKERELVDFYPIEGISGDFSQKYGSIL